MCYTIFRKGRISRLVNVMAEDDRGKRKLPKKVQFWDTDEPGTIIVTLHYGWTFDACGHEGVRGFDTAAEALREVRAATKCECKECVK